MKTLLVEADLEFARWIQGALDDFRPGVFAVEHVGQLAAALERLGHGDIEIVLLDLMLPESSGIETFRRVFDAAAGVPIVILADASDGITFAETLRGGAQDFLMRRHLNGHTLFRSMLCAIRTKPANNCTDAARSGTGGSG